MALPRPSRPSVLWQDLKSFAGTQGRVRVLIAIISILMPVVIVAGFHHDSYIEPEEQIIYVQSWPEARTDEEIKAQQKIDQARREAAINEKRQQFRKLADSLGIEYDE